jgi:hypothetical protein
MPQAIQVELDGFNRAKRRAKAGDEHRIRPRFVSIRDACDYIGCGRTYFYEKLLPKVKTARLGKRNLIELESLDDLADSLPRSNPRQPEAAD